EFRFYGPQVRLETGKYAIRNRPKRLLGEPLDPRLNRRRRIYVEDGGSIHPVVMKTRAITSCESRADGIHARMKSVRELKHDPFFSIRFRRQLHLLDHSIRPEKSVSFSVDEENSND